MEDDEMEEYWPPSPVEWLERFLNPCDRLASGAGRDFVSDMMEHQAFVAALLWAFFVSLLLSPSYPLAGLLVPVTGFVFLLGYVFSDIREQLKEERTSLRVLNILRWVSGSVCIGCLMMAIILSMLDQHGQHNKVLELPAVIIALTIIASTAIYIVSGNAYRKRTT